MVRKKTIATGIGTGISIVALMFFVVAPARAGIFDSVINAFNTAFSKPSQSPSSESGQSAGEDIYEYVKIVDMTADPRCPCDTSYEMEDCDSDGDKKFTANAQGAASCFDAYSIATESADVKRLVYKKYNKKGASVGFNLQSTNPNIVSGGHFCIKDQCITFDPDKPEYNQAGCWVNKFNVWERPAYNSMSSFGKVTRLSQNNETPESCILLARNHKFRFASLAKGGHCYGGEGDFSDITVYSKEKAPIFVDKAENIMCTTPCIVDPSKWCGGENYFSIYAASKTPRQRILADRGGWLCSGGDAKCMKYTEITGDRDGDGVLDNFDDCPEIPGPHWGCPSGRAGVEITYGEQDLSVTFHVTGDVNSIHLNSTVDDKPEAVSCSDCGRGTHDRNLTLKDWSCYKGQKKYYSLTLYSSRPLKSNKTGKIILGYTEDFGMVTTKQLPCTKLREAKIVGWESCKCINGAGFESPICQEGDYKSELESKDGRLAHSDKTCQGLLFSTRSRRCECPQQQSSPPPPPPASSPTPKDCTLINGNQLRCKDGSVTNLPETSILNTSPLVSTFIETPSGTGCVGLTTCGNR